MNRKDFLGCCGLAAFGARTAAAAEEGTPCDRKFAFAQRWAKSWMTILEREVDQPTRVRLMQAMGRACYRGAHGDPPAQKPAPEALDQLIATMKKYGGEEAARREGDVVHFQYVRNAAGLRVADGWCLCPLVEKGPPGLSGTYCECSVGYVSAMFERNWPAPVKVELLESLKRGGKTCRFRITLEKAAV